MKSLLTLLLALNLLNAVAQKNAPVSGLPTVDSVGQNDYFPIVQGGLYHKAYIWQLPHYNASVPSVPGVPVVAQPLGQVVFGTGAGISSDSGLTYTPAGLFLARYKGAGAAVGVGNLSRLGGQDSSAIMFAGKMAVVSGNNVAINANDSTTIYAGNTIALGARNIIINGGHFTNNTVSGNSFMDENVIYNEGTMAHNMISTHSEITRGFLFDGEATVNANIFTADTALGGLVPGLSWFELFNDCHIDSNILTASGTFESIHSIATSSVTGNQLIGTKQFMSVGDIMQSQEDLVNHNVLEGTSSAIENIHQMGNSSVNYDTLIGDSSSIQNIVQINSGINNCRLDSSNYSFQNIDMKESGIYNADNINITGLNLQGVNLNLKGFNRNISNENIINGDGYFAQAVNLHSAAAGDSVVAYVNLIPPGYSITKIVATASDITPGVTVIMGLETDDSALVTIASDSLVSGNLIWTGVSKSASANRSFYIQIRSISILADIRIYVEFAQLNTDKDYVVYRH